VAAFGLIDGESAIRRKRDGTSLDFLDARASRRCMWLRQWAALGLCRAEYRAAGFKAADTGKATMLQ